MDDTPGRLSRRRLLALLAGTAGLSGCAGLFDPDAGRPSGGDQRLSGRPTDRSGTPNRPYEADQRPTLDDPGGLVVRNLAAGSRYLTVVVTDGEREVYVESRSVRGGETVPVPDLIGDPGDYGVVIETADGERASYDWTVSRALPDLWVDLTPAISFRRPVRCLRDCGSLATVTTPPPATFPTAVPLTGRRDRSPALWLDNDSDASRTARLRIADGDDLFVAEYDLPPDARAVVPVSGRRRAYRVELSTDAGEISEEWVPRLRRTLYGVVGGSPAFRCGLAAHDLLIDNETTARRTVSVAVTAGGVGVFDRAVTLSPGEVRRLPSAVDPRGTLTFVVTTDDGRRERYDWRFCAPRGPISITVGDRGIDVTVTPSGR